MMSPKNKKDVALIVGPTASGKSALALELAKKQDSVVINADSAQVYSDLQILSARPSKEEMQGIPHQLYGYIDGSEACSAARWAQDCKKSIDEAHQMDKLPILVGGTGLYIRTLLDGISPIPQIDPEIRIEIRQLETLEAYRALAQEDKIAADRLNENDRNRIQRALEVIRSTGKPLDHWHENKVGGIAEQIDLKAMILLPPREWLYERCDRRFAIMLETGAVEEVKALLKRNLPDDRPAMRAIGVPDIRDLLLGKIDKETAIDQAQMATRRYAKRQYTWFRNQSPTSWRHFAEEINVRNINNIITLFQE
ncbi:MAG: tRNA (adenosine(37)-N6)-dimethylallyltransferase MiaA [Parasphingorhabdus sp.]